MTITTCETATVNGGEWLSAIYHHPELGDKHMWCAPELILTSTSDASEVAARIARRGRKVGDRLGASFTEADVADVVQDLISLGFFVDELSVEIEPGTKEHCLRFAIPT